MQLNWQQHINNKYGKNYQWQSFAKGSSNTLYRGEYGCDDLVVRVNAPSSLTPGVDRVREAALLALIANYRWSPSIFENQHEQGWCAMQCYVPFTETTLLEQQKPQLITAITDLQLINIDKFELRQKLVIQYENLWDSLYLPEALRQQNQQVLDWITKIKQLLKTLPEVPSCLVHHDLHVGNLAIDQTVSPERLILLDWEYGGLGNPWIDAATLKSLLGIADKDISNLPAFEKLSSENFNKGLAQAIELFSIIGNIWHWLRAQQSN